jgi:hypothetical protein
MHTIIDEDEYETVFDSRPCTTCKGNLSKCTGVGCNGHFSIGSRRRDPAEIARLRAERQAKREDAVLAEADAIRARRASGKQPT